MSIAVPFVFAAQTGPIPLSQLDANFAFGFSSLADTTTPTLGAGLVGYSAAVTYPANTVGAAIQSGVAAYVTAKSFGATGAGYPTDDSVALQAAINYCVTNKRALFLNAGSYYCASQLTFSAGLSMLGEGQLLSVIVSGYAGAGGALQGSFTAPALGLVLRDFGITALAAGQGVGGTSPAVCTSALRIVLAGSSGYMSDSVIERLYLGQTSGGTGDFAGWGLVLDNSIGNQDGFFTSTVRNCQIQNGINGVYVGDSVQIHANTISDGPTPKTTGVGGLVGVLLTVQTGAANIGICDNNITTSGGAIAITGANQVLLENNQCEFQAGKSGALYTPYGASAFASNRALVYLNNVKFFKVYGNNFNPAADFFDSYNVFGAVAHGTTTADGMTIPNSGPGQIFPGMQVAGFGVPAGTRVVSVGGAGGGVGAGSIVMSQTATIGSGNFPFGLVISNSNAGNTAPGNNIFTYTGTPSNGTTTIGSLSSTAGLQVGMTVQGLQVPLDAIVATINTGAGSLTFSSASSGTCSGSASTTLSFGNSPAFAIRVVDGASASLNNLCEGNDIFLGAVAHVRVEAGTANYPTLQFGPGNTFKGAVPCPLIAPPVPISAFPFTSTTSTGNITYNGFGAGGTYTPVGSGASGMTSPNSFTAIYQQTGNSVSVTGAFSATWPGANQTFAIELSLPVMPLVSGSSLVLLGTATGQGGVGGGAQTNTPDIKAYIAGTGPGGAGSASCSFSFQYLLTTP